MFKLKRSIIAKGVENFTINAAIKTSYVPKSGDLAVFEILEIGKHKALQGLNGNNNYIFPGDQVLCAFGTRYASEQFEGYVPEKYHDEYQILGQGGVVGVLHSMHEKFKDIGPTTVKLIGYATDENGQVINSIYHQKNPIAFQKHKIHPFKILLSVGSSMDSGKTTTAAFLCRGLSMLEKKVAYIKLTGTVYAKDRSFVRDCGAELAIDFSTMGFPSTYMCSMTELLDLYETLLGQVATIEPDYVVIEIADGLLQKETYALLNNKDFMNTTDGLVLSCGDSMSTLNGLNILKQLGAAPFAISGVLTASPLLSEEVRNFCETPVMTIEDFLVPEKLTAVLQSRLLRSSAA